MLSLKAQIAQAGTIFTNSTSFADGTKEVFTDFLPVGRESVAFLTNSLIGLPTGILAAVNAIQKFNAAPTLSAGAIGSVTVNPASGIAVGDLIYIHASNDGTVGAIPNAISDSLGNVFKAMGLGQYNSFSSGGSTEYHQTWSCRSIGTVAGGGAYTIHVTFAVANTGTVTIAVINGLTAVQGSVSQNTPVVTSPFLGNPLRAGPIPSGNLFVPGPAMVIFGSISDFTADTTSLLPVGWSNLPAVQPPNSVLFNTIAPNTLIDPFILAEVAGGGDSAAGAATASYFFSSTPVPVGCFICDSTMIQGASPLLADGTLDPQLIGPMIGSVTFGNIMDGRPKKFDMPTEVVLAPGQFLRFATFSGKALFPAFGFSRVRIMLSTLDKNGRAMYPVLTSQ